MNKTSGGDGIAIELYAEFLRNVGLDEAQAGIKLLGETSIISDMQMKPLLWQKVKKNKKAF